MTTIEKELDNKSERPGFFATYRQMLPAIIRHPATWLLAGLWLAAAIYLLASGTMPGKFPTVFLFFYSLVSLLIMLLGLPLTQGAPPAVWETSSSPSKGKAWLQVGVTLLCTAAVALIALYGALYPSSALGVLIHNSILFRSGLALVGEAIIPVALLLPLGLRWREMGFSRGYHIWSITLLWSAPSLLIIVYGLAVGKVTLLIVLLRFIILLVFTAIPEEIAFRGIITTRLMRLLGTGWGIALASLVFGLLHLGTNFFLGGGSTTLLTAIAVTIFGQMPGGLMFSISLQRTRSLIPGFIGHALGDSASLIFLS